MSRTYTGFPPTERMARSATSSGASISPSNLIAYFAFPIEISPTGIEAFAARRPATTSEILRPYVFMILETR